jgi:hypothetical protein
MSLASRRSLGSSLCLWSGEERVYERERKRERESRRSEEFLGSRRRSKKRGKTFLGS